MKKPDSNIILNCRSCLVNYYLEKKIVNIEHNSKQLSSAPNDVKLIIYVIDKQKTDYVMVCTTEIYSVSKTINKLYIHSPLHSVYQHNLHHDKQDIIDEIFYQCHLFL